ncbi:signal transduction histidine kinase [Kordiimonas sediminis]|uniref:Signal transduction histidine kinase n=1 Tax=Kordiimonas sediminis TaxID=1735581 RepID=A0A919E2Y2_9PROT|nr:PAS domain-containing methyl-accepting chemotaxis protein [Kordiimonas sediminis]GHF14088.1 signal transduction histidine kinase [Kordiimonas sediminis]
MFQIFTPSKTNSETQFIKALDTSLAMIEFSITGEILNANQNFLDILGYKLEDIVGKHHRIFLSEQERTSSSYKAFWQELAGGIQKTGQFCRFSKSGEQVWIQATYSPVSDKNGKIVSVVKVASDISAEMAQKFRNDGILQAIDRSQGVIEFAPDGTILNANNNFLKLVGYTLEELKGRHHRLFVANEYAMSTEYETFWQTLRQGTFFSDTFRRFNKDGDSFWIQATYNPIMDHAGNVIRVVKLATDVTNEVNRNIDTTAQLEALRKTTAVIAFSPDGIILDANANFLSALGYSLPEIQGKHHKIFLDASQIASKEYQEFWTSLASGKAFTGEFKRISKNGDEVWIQASYNPVLDTDGKVVKIVKFATDITDVIQRRRIREQVGGKVDTSLQKILTTVSDVTNKCTSVTTATEQSLMTVQSVAAATQQFETSNSEISRNMAMSRDMARTAKEEARYVDRSSAQLQSSAQSMSSVTKVISDIAAQINLLALNATIESARAGEAGKGFAVVASEVKNLSTQVAAATEDIGIEIRKMQTVSEDVVGNLARINQSIEELEHNITSISSAVEEQSSTTSEINRNMQLAQQAVTEINSNIKDISDEVTLTDELANAGVLLYKELRAQEMNASSVQ